MSNCFAFVLFAVCLVAVVEGAANNTCVAGCPPCTAGDTGGCCSQFIEYANKSYCDPYCMVANYQCCGCVVVNVTNDIFECFSCPASQTCFNNSRHQNPLPGNQTRWYCASGSALAPSRFYLAILALALLLFFLAIFFRHPVPW